MRHQATGVAIAGVMVLATVFAATSADAQPRWSDKTRLTFDGPVVVPGVTLAAGTYTLLADSLANRQIVQIWNEDETKLFNTTLAIPTRRTDTSGDVVVKFQRTEAGMAPAIKAWFYPGQRTGHMFVYSGEQARALAKGNKTLVLPSDDDPSVEDIAAERQSERRTYQVDEHGTRTEYTPPRVEAAAWDDATQPDAVEDRAEGRRRARLRAEVGGHLDKADQLVVLMLRPVVVQSAPGGEADRPVGTSGSASGQKDSTLSIDRNMLEQLQAELQQARAVLDRAMDDKRSPERKP